MIRSTCKRDGCLNELFVGKDAAWMWQELKCLHQQPHSQMYPWRFYSRPRSVGSTVRIKARFLRQCEQRFARYHKIPLFIKMRGWCYRLIRLVSPSPQTVRTNSY